jgi:hypothetical protein
MSELHPGARPDDYEAFASSAPAYDSDADPDLSRTAVFLPVDPYGVGAGEPEPRRGLGERISAFGRARAVVVGLVAAAVIAGVAWATSAVFASADPSSAAAPPAGGAAAAPLGHPKKAGTTVKLTITEVGPSSFTGTDKKGKTFTVVFTAATKFGNKAHPLTPGELRAGMVVTVLGARNGDTITASGVAIPVKKQPATVAPSPST